MKKRDHDKIVQAIYEKHREEIRQLRAMYEGQLEEIQHVVDVYANSLNDVDAKHRQCAAQGWPCTTLTLSRTRPEEAPRD